MWSDRNHWRSNERLRDLEGEGSQEPELDPVPKPEPGSEPEPESKKAEPDMSHNLNQSQNPRLDQNLGLNQNLNLKPGAKLEPELRSLNQDPEPVKPELEQEPEPEPTSEAEAEPKLEPKAEIHKIEQTHPWYSGASFASVSGVGARTALHHAASRGLDVTPLLEAGADAFLSDAEGNTALHLAAREGCVNAVNQLLQVRAQQVSLWKSPVLCAASDHASFILSCAPGQNYETQILIVRCV